MRSLFGKVCVITFSFIGIGFPFDSFAAKYTGKTASSQFSEETPVPQKPLPPEAQPLPEEDLKVSAPITFDELRLFVRDWRKYTRWLKKDGNEYKAVAYLGVSPSSDYPPEVVKWMDEHGWAVDRFFLLERKFRETLSIQKQDAKQSVLRSHLERQIQDAENDRSLTMDQRKEMIQKYRESIMTLRSTAGNKAPVTPEEYELIKLNHDVLSRILDE